MFKVIVHFDGYVYTDKRRSYEKAIELFISLDKIVASFRASAVISDYYIELVKEI